MAAPEGNPKTQPSSRHSEGVKLIMTIVWAGAAVLAVLIAVLAWRNELDQLAPLMTQMLTSFRELVLIALAGGGVAYGAFERAKRSG